MQYLKELPSGNRVPVSQEQFMLDKFDPSYHQIIATSGLIIYKLAKRMSVSKVARPLRYGGRGRGGPCMAWNGA